MSDSAVDNMAALRTVAEAFEGVCDSLTVSDWTRATPCPDWNLAALVDHVIGGNRFTVAILNGATSAAALTSTLESFGDRRTNSAEAISSMRQLVRAFRQPDALTRRCHHVERDLTGQQVLRLRLHDLIVHTWDIKQSVNPPAGLPPTLTQWGLGELADPESLAAPPFGISARSQLGAGYLSAFGRHSASRPGNVP